MSNETKNAWKSLWSNVKQCSQIVADGTVNGVKAVAPGAKNITHKAAAWVADKTKAE